MILNIHEPIKQVLISLSVSLLLATAFFIYKFVFKKRLNLFVMIILISILPVLSIFRFGTYQAGDLTLHSVFLQSFFENIKDGIVIPQWAGGLCGKYGCPVFMFEYTMPFYIASIFHLLGFSFLDSIKLFLASSYILSGITMFLLLKEHLNEKSAFIGSLLYLFAPIRFIEMHFRVSVGTDAAFIFIPLTFLFFKKSLERKWVYVILGAINFLFLILSHSSVTFVIVFVALAYVFIIKKNLRDCIYPITSFILGIGLSAFYVFPAILELQYTWYKFFSAVNEFYPIFYYIFSPAYFGFLFQNNGELRLIVGYAQLLILFLGIYYLFKNKFNKQEKKIVLFLIIIFIICFTLMLSFTKPLWNAFFFLKTFILPWRMLVPISFVLAYLGAVVVKKWKTLPLSILAVFIIFSTILNWANRKMIPEDTNAYNTHWSLYSEYIDPIDDTFAKAYKEQNLLSKSEQLIFKRPKESIELIYGSAEIKQISRTNINHSYLIYAKTDVYLRENTFYFPGWTVIANNNDIQINYKYPKRLGIITFKLKKGIYLVNVSFKDTNIRLFAKEISYISIILCIIIFMKIINSKFSKIKKQT